MSIALAAMSDLFIKGAQAANIPLDVLHRVVAMASGGMDTLPHNGAVITLLAVTGLTHRESYRDIFAVTIIKTLAVFFVIAVYYTTGPCNTRGGPSPGRRPPAASMRPAALLLPFCRTPPTRARRLTHCYPQRNTTLVAAAFFARRARPTLLSTVTACDRHRRKPGGIRS